MNDSKTPPPEPIACLGRSDALNDAGIVQLWQRLQRLRLFESNRQNGEGYQSIRWYVDQLPVLSAFDSYSVNVTTPAEYASWEYEKAWEMLEIQPWMEGVTITGKLETDFGGTRTEMGIILSLRDPDSSPVHRRRWPAMCSLGNLRDDLRLEEVLDFYRRAFAALGLSEAIEITSKADRAWFKILNREPKGRCILDISTCREDSGPLQGGVSLGMTDTGDLRRVMDAALAHWPERRLWWDSVSFGIKDSQMMGEARSWLAHHHDGLWEMWHTLTAREVWTPEKFQARDPSLDLIPAGRLDFPRRGTTAATLPNALRGVHLLVDLFKEGDRWHFAFHFFENRFSRTKRENIRNALNNFLGFDLVTRTPETLWPGVFPS